MLFWVLSEIKTVGLSSNRYDFIIIKILYLTDAIMLYVKML